MNFPTASPANDERIKNPLGNFPSSAHECHFASHIYLTNLTDGLARACNKHTIFGAGIGRPSHATLSVANWASPQQSPRPATGEISRGNLQLHPALFQRKTLMMTFPTLQSPHKEWSLFAQKNLFSDPDRKISWKMTPIEPFSCCFCAECLSVKDDFSPLK